MDYFDLKLGMFFVGLLCRILDTTNSSLATTPTPTHSSVSTPRIVVFFRSDLTRLFSVSPVGSALDVARAVKPYVPRQKLVVRRRPILMGQQQCWSSAVLVISSYTISTLHTGIFSVLIRVNFELFPSSVCLHVSYPILGNNSLIRSPSSNVSVWINWSFVI